MANINTSARFHLNFAGKQIVGTKASYDKAGKGYGPIYDELVALMAKHPTFECAVVAPKEPAKPKQTYKGMNVDFMLDYASAVDDGKYLISNCGRVKSLKHCDARLLKAFANNKGYLRVCLSHKGKGRHFLVSRLVASAFCENDDP